MLKFNGNINYTRQNACQAEVKKPYLVISIGGARNPVTLENSALYKQ